MENGIFTVLDIPYSPSDYRRIDLGLLDPKAYRVRLEEFFAHTGARVAYGGYLERRRLYTEFGHFSREDSQPRDVHLGLDLWAPAGTPVCSPWPGMVHSLANRTGAGDYGGVLILEHQRAGETIHTLYGHLDFRSIPALRKGTPVDRGMVLGRLGNELENGGYLPHLHFQLIRDLEGNLGDYPGVCSEKRLEYYRQNCPDPASILGLP